MFGTPERIFFKKSADDDKSMKNYPARTEISTAESGLYPKRYHSDPTVLYQGI